MMLVASVPMNELIRVRSITIPLTIPSPRPVAIPAIRPRVGEAEFATLQATTPETLTFAPTERSKTPAMMHSVSPQASRPIAAHWSRMFEPFWNFRNEPEAKLSATKSATNA